MLAEQSLESDASVRARNYTIFLSLKEQIEEALAEGWSLLKIWQALTNEGEIDFSYQALGRFMKRSKCNRDLKRQKNNKDKTQTDEKPPQTARAGDNLSKGKAQVFPDGSVITADGKFIKGWPKPGTVPPTPIILDKGKNTVKRNQT